MLPKIIIKFKVEKDGVILHEHEEPGRSWTRSGWNMWTSAMLEASYYGTNNTFGEGQLSLCPYGTFAASYSTTQINRRNSATYAAGGVINNGADADSGILIGTNGAAWHKNDYMLYSKIAHGTGSGQMTHLAQGVGTIAYDRITKKWTNTFERLFNNNSAGSITVREVGLHYRGSIISTLVTRDVLAVPVSVEVGAQLTVTYVLESISFADLETSCGTRMDQLDRWMTINGGGTIIDETRLQAAWDDADAGDYFIDIASWFSADGAYIDAGSGKVSRLYDLSLHQNDMVQATDSRRPIWTAAQQNGLAGLVFDGTDDNLAGPSVKGYTIFVVFRTTNTSPDNKHFLGNNDSSYEFHGGQSGNMYDAAYASVGYNAQHWINGAATEGSAVVKSASFKILSLEWAAGANLAQIAWAQSNYSNRAYPGVFLELIFFGNQLSTAKREAVEADLNARWAIY